MVLGFSSHPGLYFQMAKAFLILMLTVSQVLAGTCGPRYLCFKADGSFCCVDEGGSDCICCPEELVKPPSFVVKESSCGCRHGDEPDFEESKSSEQVPAETEILSSGGDGCSHVPVIDGGLVTTAKRCSFAVELYRVRDLTVTPLCMVVHSNESRTRYASLSHCSSRTLADLAWMSIRC